MLHSTVCWQFEYNISSHLTCLIEVKTRMIVCLIKLKGKTSFTPIIHFYQIYIHLFCIHKRDHPLSEPLPLFVQGQMSKWPVALYGREFYDVVKAVWRPSVLLSLTTRVTVATRKVWAVLEVNVAALKSAPKSIKQNCLQLLTGYKNTCICVCCVTFSTITLFHYLIHSFIRMPPFKVHY